MRKFADKQRTNKEQSSKQIKGSNTEATLILCGYSGERANNCLTKPIAVLCVIYLDYYSESPGVTFA